MPFVRFPHPALSRGAVRRPLDAPMQFVAEQLLLAAQASQAYGLAAAHLGLVEPVIVVSVAADPSRRDYQVMFNPRVLDCSQDTESGVEGSVALPGMEVEISRPSWVVIDYDDDESVQHSARYEGFVGRCCLHEIEQMDGVFFLAHLSRLKREAVLRKFKKGQRSG